VIEPLRKGDPYPGRRPPVSQQWLALSVGTRVALVGVPLVLLAALIAASRPAGVAAAVLVVGVAAATITYVKNRTDRHNAAIDRGELTVPADPHITRVDPSTLDNALIERLGQAGLQRDDIGSVSRFDGGWIVRRRNPRDVASVLGDDGGLAFFDPRWVPDLHAATEYLAGRGREPV